MHCTSNVILQIDFFPIHISTFEVFNSFFFFVVVSTRRDLARVVRFSDVLYKFCRLYTGFVKIRKIVSVFSLSIRFLSFFKVDIYTRVLPSLSAVYFFFYSSKTRDNEANTAHGKLNPRFYYFFFSLVHYESMAIDTL